VDEEVVGGADVDGLGAGGDPHQGKAKYTSNVQPVSQYAADSR